MNHTLCGLHLINDDWIASAGGGPTFQAINPASGAALPTAFAEAGDAEVNAALESADRAFRLSHDLPQTWPAELLELIAARVMDLGDGLLERAEAETALPRARLIGERGRTCGQLQMFAKVVREGSWVEATIDTADPNRKPAPRPDLRRMLRPRGPVVVFGASNFPLAFGVLGGDTASALAAGCPVVVKGHPSHPGVSELMASAVLAALQDSKIALPPGGWFALLQGRGHALSQALVRHPLTTAVGFTGSLKAGRALFDLAAARQTPIPVYAEMGSANPLIVLPGAIAERGEKIAQELCGSVLLGGGQFCTKPGLIFTIGEEATFVQSFAASISAAAAPTLLNRDLRDRFCNQVEAFAQVAGVRRVSAGAAQGHAGAAPALFETSSEIWKSHEKLHEEAFGPGALVVHCRGVEDALDCIDHLEGSLTGTIHLGSADAAIAPRVLRHLESKVGRVIFNGYPTGVEVNDSIVHGGPYPATTDPGTTSVGSAAIKRFVRLIAFQDTPDALLPAALKNDNPLKISRLVNGVRTGESLPSL
jgi:NADP-dependent aldehyde dehydrogenase